MTYTALNLAKPDAATDNGTAFASHIRNNQRALRDAIVFGGVAGWTYSQSGGSAAEPAIQLWSSGTERLRLTSTWGSSGGENGNLIAATLEYSSDSGSTWDAIESRALSYDAGGNFTAGKHVLQLSRLQGLPGIVKQGLASVRANTVSAGTGITGGGALSSNPSLSFSTTWGDARYATLSGAAFTGPIGVHTATHTVQTPAALAVDWTAGHRQAKDIAANSTFTFTAPSGPSNLLIKVKNTSASARTLGWPAAVKWSSSPPAHPASSTALYMFYYDGASYFGSYVQGYVN